jgi:hypothetical protein
MGAALPASLEGFMTRGTELLDRIDKMDILPVVHLNGDLIVALI